MTGSELRILFMSVVAKKSPFDGWWNGVGIGTYAFEVNLSNTSRVERTTREI